MFHKIIYVGLLIGSIVLAGNAQATKLSAVAYGTISAVSKQDKDTSGGKTGGAIIGGLLGLATSSGRSTGTKLLRSGVGAAAGSAVGGAAASGTEMAYTVDLVGGGTVRVVMAATARAKVSPATPVPITRKSHSTRMRCYLFLFRPEPTICLFRSSPPPAEYRPRRCRHATQLRDVLLPVS